MAGGTMFTRTSLALTQLQRSGVEQNINPLVPPPPTGGLRPGAFSVAYSLAFSGGYERRP